MNKTTILLLIIMATSASAAVTFTITPQTGYPGQQINVPLNLENDQPIWGFSTKITENPGSPIAFSSATPTSRLNGGLNGATPNNPDRITVYSAFAGNTPGIIAGNGAVFTITYDVPVDTPLGQYQLELSDLTVSDQDGQPIQTTAITGATITIEEEPETEIYLPYEYLFVNEQKDITVCITNTDTQRAVKSVQMTITYNQQKAQALSAEILQGTGSSEILVGSTSLTINGLNVINANCEEQTGANVAKIRFLGKEAGVTPLTIQSSSAIDQYTEPFSVQALENYNGQITVGNTQSPPPTTGGGGGSQKYQTFQGCAKCADLNSEYFECCGKTIDEIRYFCEHPHDQYCKKKTPNPVPLEQLPVFPQAIPPQTEQTTTEAKQPEVKQPEVPTKQNSAGEAIKRELPTTTDDNLLPWLIAGALVLLVGGAFGTYTMFRKRPETQEIPIPEPQQEVSIPEPVQPEPVKQTVRPEIIMPVVEIKTTPQKKVSKEEYNRIIKQIKKRLAKRK
jgi:hypothetical protein